MLLLSILIAIFAFILIALVAGNNMPVCAGALISSRITSKRTGIAIAVLGYIAGLVLEGSFLKRGIAALLPVSSGSFVLIALLIAVIIFIIAHMTRVPQSLSVNFTSILLGISVALGLKVDWPFVSGIVFTWVAAPVIAVIAVLFIMRRLKKRMQEKSIWNTAEWIKFLLIIVSFFTAFTLGANTIGLVFSAMPDNAYNVVIAIAAIIVGSIALSSGVLKRIGNEIISMRYLNSLNAQFVSTILVEVATLFGVPLSSTQTFTASVYGAGISYKNRLLSKKTAKRIIYVWITGIPISFVLGFIATLIFVH